MQLNVTSYAAHQVMAATSSLHAMLQLYIIQFDMLASYCSYIHFMINVPKMQISLFSHILWFPQQVSNWVTVLCEYQPWFHSTH